MSYKKTTADPFSNGTEFMWFLERNCSWCVKHPHPHVHDHTKDTKCRCTIYNEILQKMYDKGGAIKALTVDICNKGRCPYIKKEYPRHTARYNKRLVVLMDEQQPSLFRDEELT